MEPTIKKRKLAPKISVSPISEVPPATTTTTSFTHEQTSSHDNHQNPHNASLAETQDFETFARHLHDAAMLIQRQSERSAYLEVSVLLLTWEDDGSVHHDVAAFEQVLQDKYRFTTRRWQIPPVSNPSSKLATQITSFLQDARSDHLLIIHYAGLGYVESDGQWFWACNSDKNSARLQWDGVQCLFQDARSDMLLLLDSCAIPGLPLAGSHGTKQGIAAATCSDHRQREQHGPSFTAKLTEAFQRLHGPRPFSVKRLYEELITNVTAGLATSTDPVPSFFTLTRGKRQLLTLAPLPFKTAALAQHQSRVTGKLKSHDNDDRLINPGAGADLRFDEGRILVYTTFIGDASPDMAFYNQWLQNTPALGALVAMEGMFLGPPTMLFMSMPPALWDVVQRRGHCCSLGTITSHNMMHLYQGLVEPVTTSPAARHARNGGRPLDSWQITIDASSQTPEVSEPHNNGDQLPGNENSKVDSDERKLSQNRGRPHSRCRLGGEQPMTNGEETSEIQEAAKQLKALSHLPHANDEADTGEQPQQRRRRTTLPDGISDAARQRTRLLRQGGEGLESQSTTLIDVKMTHTSRHKGSRRSMTKQETRCSQCNHGPFKDSSSLRKHVNTAHTRPFPCAFSFAGCRSTFGSKNEWKRHIGSQHLCLQYYRCSECPRGAAGGRGIEFNRKDLFTQHLRRMHAPFRIKKTPTVDDGQTKADWDAYVQDMQQSCLVTRRKPPQKAACPKLGCHREFEGANAWDEWTEHVGRHMEKDGGPRFDEDKVLSQWALDEGIIERTDNGRYKLCPAGGIMSQRSSASEICEKDPMNWSFTEPSQVGEALTDEIKPVTTEVDGSPTTTQ